MNNRYIKIIKNERGRVEKALVDSETLDTFCKLLIRRNSIYLTLNNIKENQTEPYEINNKDFYDILMYILEDDDHHLYNKLVTDGEPTYLIDYINEFNQLIDEYGLIRQIGKIGIISFLRELYENPDNLLSIIEMSKSINEKYIIIYKIKDLGKAKEDIEKDLKFFVKPELIDDFQKRYDEAFSKLDVDRMQKILEEIQQLILEHYRECVTDIDNFKNGDKFNFICHSVGSPKFIGDFIHRFVSTSLLSNSLMETFNGEYGFIFAPENIVLANTSDSYVNNDADNVEDIVTSSTISIIHSPERLIDDCVKLKEYNRSINSNQKVYNEIVLDGFSPIAIFCLTDGLTELNENYRNAHELQKSFPNLKVIVIDKTLYKTDIDLLGTKKAFFAELLNKTRQSDLIFRSYDITDNMVSKYEIFWEQFLDYKKSEDFNELELLEKFKHLDSLISKPIDDCSIFNDEELAIALKNNPFIGTCFIVSGSIDNSILMNVYHSLNSYPSKEKLDDIIPGISTFLELYQVCINSNINPVDPRFNECTSLAEVNRILTDLVTYHKDKNLTDIDYMKFKLELGMSQLNEYKRILEEKQSLLDKNNFYEKIINSYFSYVIAKSEIDLKEEIIDRFIDEEKEYEEKEKEYLTLIHNTQEELIKLKKHPIINMSKIRRKEQEQLLYQAEVDEYSIYKKANIKQIKRIDKEISSIKEELKEKTGVEYSSYEDLVIEANSFRKKVSVVDLLLEIRTLKYRIESIEEDITRIKSYLELLENSEITTYKVDTPEEQEPNKKK